MRGALFTGLGQGARAVLHLASIVLLARLLTPADFGIFAMVSPAIVLGTMLSEAGLGSAVIQRQKLTDAELSSVFWVNGAAGLLIALALVAAAPALAAFYGDERVEALAVASSAVIVISSLTSPYLALLNRQMRYESIAIIDAVSLLVGTVVAVVVAAGWRTYWALWLLPFSTAICTLVLGQGLSKWRPGRGAPLAQVRDMLGFGGHMLTSRLFDFASRNFDKVLIGRVWGSTELGLYDRAYRIVLLPLLFINIPLERLILPILVRTVDNPARYRQTYSLGLQFALLLAMPPIMVIIVAPEPIVRIILGQEWLSSAPMFRWLAVVCLLQLASHTLGALLMSQGRSRDVALVSMWTSVYWCAAFAIGLHWGATGVATAYAVGEILRTPFLFWWASRRGPVGPADQFRILAPFLVGAAIAVPAIRALGSAVEASPWLFLAAAVPAAYLAAVAGLASTRTGRKCLKEAYGVASGVRAAPSALGADGRA